MRSDITALTAAMRDQANATKEYFSLLSQQILNLSNVVHDHARKRPLSPDQNTNSSAGETLPMDALIQSEGSNNKSTDLVLRFQRRDIYEFTTADIKLSKLFVEWYTYGLENPNMWTATKQIRDKIRVVMNFALKVLGNEKIPDPPGTKSPDRLKWQFDLAKLGNDIQKRCMDELSRLEGGQNSRASEPSVSAIYKRLYNIDRKLRETSASSSSKTMEAFCNKSAAVV